MEPADITPNLDDLTSQIDDLTTALHPLLNTPLHTTTSTLPLLDKAKLHILLSYTIESLLFSVLLTSTAKPKEHPLFAELARLKTYFGKIKAAEQGPEQPKTRLDKEAAGRFIKHGLSGNERFDREREQKRAEDIKRGMKKAREIGKKVNIKFDEEVESKRMAALPASSRQEEEGEDGEGQVDVDSENEEMYGGEETNKAYDEMAAPPGSNLNDDASSSTPTTSSSSTKKRKSKKSEGSDKSEKHRTRNVDRRGKSKEEIKAERRETKQQRRADRATAPEGKEKETIIPAKGAPKTPGEAFKALLEGPKQGNGSKKGKRK